jgi:hypothetical protein
VVEAGDDVLRDESRQQRGQQRPVPGSRRALLPVDALGEQLRVGARQPDADRQGCRFQKF